MSIVHCVAAAVVLGLALIAGPGVRFIIESPAKGALTAELKRTDMPAFAAALGRVKAYLGTP